MAASAGCGYKINQVSLKRPWKIITKLIWHAVPVTCREKRATKEPQKSRKNQNNNKLRLGKRFPSLEICSSGSANHNKLSALHNKLNVTAAKILPCLCLQLTKACSPFGFRLSDEGSSDVSLLFFFTELLFLKVGVGASWVVTPKCRWSLGSKPSPNEWDLEVLL